MEIGIKWAMNWIKQDTYDGAHGKDFIPRVEKKRNYYPEDREPECGKQPQNQNHLFMLLKTGPRNTSAR